MNHQYSEIRLTISSQHLTDFISFLGIFKDLPFYFENYLLESIFHLIHFFGLFTIHNSLWKSSFLKNIQETLEFLDNHSCEAYSSIVEESLDILIQYVLEIRRDSFSYLMRMNVFEKYLKTNHLVFCSYLHSASYSILILFLFTYVYSFHLTIKWYFLQYIISSFSLFSSR
jgi:hypothetical protein